MGGLTLEHSLKKIRINWMADSTTRRKSEFVLAKISLNVVSHKFLL